MKENEFAIFECEVSHKNIPIDWFVGDVKVEPSAKYQVFMENNVHRLSINMAKPKDEGPIKAVFRNVSTTARLYVERK